MTNEPIQRIRALLDTQPALATMANDCERTPLHLAAQRGNLKLAGILIEFGADVNARDSEKASVLDLAVEYNQGDFVELLMERGVEEKTLERNKKRFGEMKSGIRFKRESNDRTPNNSRRDSRTLSWAKRRGLSI
jgi:ankyrin repeat protein